VRKADENKLAWPRTTRDGPRSLLADLMVNVVAVHVVMMLCLKTMIPKSLLEADAPLSGAHEGPRS